VSAEAALKATRDASGVQSVTLMYLTNPTYGPVIGRDSRGMNIIRPIINGHYVPSRTQAPTRTVRYRRWTAIDATTGKVLFAKSLY